MVDNLAASEAADRGQRIRKPRIIFEGVASPSQGKRKRAAVEDVPSTTAALPSKNGAKLLKTPSFGLVPPPAAANNKRKRATDDDEVAATAPPPTKKAGHKPCCIYRSAAP